MKSLELAKLSKMAYDHSVDYIGFDTTKITDEQTDTECFILRNEKINLVDIRGTETDSIKDIVTDLNFIAKDGLHGGILKAYKSIENEILNLINPNVKTIYFGHSLGGGLAIVAGLKHPNKNFEVVTFGAPKVCTLDIFKTHNEMNFNNYRDILDPVPKLPPIKGFVDFGLNIYLKENSVDTEFNFFDRCAFWLSSNKEKLQAHSIDNYINKIERFKL